MIEHEHMSDEKFGKVFAAMIGGMALLTVFLIILAYAVGGEAGSQRSDIVIDASNQESMARTMPVASMSVGEATTQTAAVTAEETTQDVAAADSGAGQGVYDRSCSVCHAAGVAGAPKFGDAGAWQPRVEKGIDALYTSSLNGLNAMPPKGGNTALSDNEVKAAVDYMVNAVN